MPKYCVNPVHILFSNLPVLGVSLLPSELIPKLSDLKHTTNSQFLSVFAHTQNQQNTDTRAIFSTFYTVLTTTTAFCIKIINNPDRGIK